MFKNSRSIRFSFFKKTKRIYIEEYLRRKIKYLKIKLK